MVPDIGKIEELVSLEYLTNESTQITSPMLVALDSQISSLNLKPHKKNL